METVSPMELAKVAEHEFQYGAEAFEAHQKGTEKAMTNDKLTENVSVKSRNKRQLENAEVYLTKVYASAK